MPKRFLAALLFSVLAGLSSSSRATDYSDMWYVPAESGWGVNFTQNEGVIFMTFFLYGTDGNPTWYVAITSPDASGNFSGTLYSTTGTYFGAPWVGNTATAVGTATFAPSNAYQGTLSYALASGPTVSKTIVRQSLVAISLAGNFTGGQAGAYTACSSSSNNTAYKDDFDLSVSQANGVLTLTFAYVFLADTCTLSGALVQNGQILSVPSATYQCDGGLNTTASLSELKKTSLGIEGRFSSPSVGLGCREDAAFSAVNLQ